MSQNQNKISKILKLARKEIIELQAYASARSIFTKLDNKSSNKISYKTSNNKANNKALIEKKNKTNLKYSKDLNDKKNIIFLDANENPYNLAKEQLSCSFNINRYPDPQPQELLALFSNLYKISSQSLLLSHGSDEAIEIIIKTFCSPYKESIMICPPTYGLYKINAKIQSVKIKEINLKNSENFSLDIPNILKNWNKNIKIIFLCSPNNPTGNLLDKNDILYLAKNLIYKSIIVVDEAYIEFSRSNSLINEIKKYPNLIILRTLSKAWALAGLRCGICISHPKINKLLQKVRSPYPLTVPTIEIIKKMLKNKGKIDISINKILKEKQRIINSLKNNPFIKKIYPGDANFILIKTNDSNKIYNLCKKNNIIIRERNIKNIIDNCLRISIGNKKENDQLINFFNKTLKEKFKIKK